MRAAGAPTRRRNGAALLVALFLLAAPAPGAAAPSAAAPADPLSAPPSATPQAAAATPPAGRSPARQAHYLVVPEPGRSVAGILRRSEAAEPDAQLRRITGRALRAGLVSLTPGQARRLRTEEGVALVEPNLTFTAQPSPASAVAAAPAAPPSAQLQQGLSPQAQSGAATRTGGAFESVPITAQRVPLSWGLDRTDDFQGLDNDYSPTTNGAGVRVYVMDGNIVATHPEFAGRIGTGASFVNDATGTVGCDAHGTHVAGIIGSNLLGMATEAILHPVRVLDCTNSGTSGSLISGMNWVLADWQSRGSPPAVVNMSLGGPSSAVVGTAVANLAAAGLVVVAAAGNAEGGLPPVDACTKSPANAAPALTVGSVDIADTESVFSNWGPCLDLYAPGEDILSTDWAATPNSAIQASGTSQAAPHVAGAVAVYWSQFPAATGPQVQQAILDQASSGVITFLRPGVGSPNLLVNAQGSAPPPVLPPTAGPTPAPPAVQPTPVQLPPPLIDPTPDPGTQIVLRPPGRVKKLRVTRTTRSTITVKYRAAARAEKYKFWAAPVAAGSSRKWRKAGTTAQTRFTVRGLRPGTKYRIRAMAKNSDGVSRKSFTRGTTKGGR